MESHLTHISWDMSWIWDRCPSPELGEKWKQVHKWMQFSKCRKLVMHSRAVPVTYTCWLTNVLKVLKLSSFALSSCGLKVFIVVSHFVCFLRSKFKLSVSSICKEWIQVFWKCAESSFRVLAQYKYFPWSPYHCKGVNQLSFFPFFLSLNKIRFAKTQCEFRDYEPGR